MGRRRNGGALSGVVDLISLLPWWAAVALAVASYFFFHSLTGATPPAIARPGDVSGILGPALVRGYSLVLQYLVPVLCLVAAGLSFSRRRKRRALVSAATGSRGADVVSGITWREFEALVSEAFRLQGYAVSETGGGGADGGVDLVLRKGNESFLVQCKQWKAFKVGVDVVRELYGVMAARGATGGFVVTSGLFTSDATAFADGRNIKLFDGRHLVALLEGARASRGAPPPAEGVSGGRPTGDSPRCPVCSASMVRRTARKGASAGSQFWGCSTYPACRGTR